MGKIKIVRVKLHRWGVNDYSHVSLYKKYVTTKGKKMIVCILVVYYAEICI